MECSIEMSHWDMAWAVNVYGLCVLVQPTPVQASQTWLYVGHQAKVRCEWEDTWQNNILWEEDRSGAWIVEDQFVQLAQLSIENDILGLGLYI